MKEKLTNFEILYYVLSAYCLWASQELFSVTVKAQGTEGVSALEPALIVLGAFAPITIMTSSLISGVVVGVFILLSPLVGLVLYKDYKRKRFGIACFLLSALTTSQVVTGTYYSPMAGIGGWVSLILFVLMILITIVNVAKGEIQKQLQPIQQRKP